MNFQAIMRRFYHLFSVVTITAPPNDTQPVKTVQVQFADGYGGTRDALPVMEFFGFSSNPPVGTAGLVVSFSGDRSNGLMLGTINNSKRPVGNLTGDTVVYDANGNTIRLTNGQIIITAAAGGNLVVNAATLSCTGEVIANAGADQVLLSKHTHPYAGEAGNTMAPNPGT